MKRAVVLLSGGLDSATVVAIARSQGYDVVALTVGYGQRHAAEITAARRVAQANNIQDHRFIHVNLDAIGGSALTDNIDVPKSGESAGIPVTYVPARNTVMLSLALGLAEVTDSEAIFVGVNAVDYSGYPDCRPEYISAFQTLAQLATKVGVEGSAISVEAPLIHLRKEEIIAEGLRLGVDYAITHSCYDPDSEGRACGQCDSCRIRLAAFERLGIPDPAPYQA